MTPPQPRKNDRAHDAPSWYFLIFAAFYLFIGGMYLASIPLTIGSSSVFLYPAIHILLGVALVVAGLGSAAAVSIARYKFRRIVGVYLGGLAGMTANLVIVNSVLITGDWSSPAVWLAIFATHLHYLLFHLPANTAQSFMSALMPEDAHDTK